MTASPWETFLAEHNKAEPWHSRRYIESLQFLEAHCLTRGSVVAEQGGEGVFTRLLKQFRPDLDYRSLAYYDLRGNCPVEDNVYDVIISMEVMEHIQDCDPTTIDENATFTGSGIKKMVAETFRILKPGGWFFLTTPNVCSLKNLYNFFRHDHPYFFQPHHRELSIRDVRTYCEGAGFTTTQLLTKNIWNYHRIPLAQIIHLKRVISFAGADPANREDDIFGLFQKPSNT